MGTLLVVHGTGVREPDYSKFVDRVRGRVVEIAPKLTVSPCYWGGTLGAALKLGGKSIPSYDTTRGMEAEEDDIFAALWALLADDPLFELRMLASERGKANTGPPTADTPAQILENALRQMAPCDSLEQSLQRSGLAADFDAARARVANSEPFRDAARNAAGDALSLRIPVARAVVAEALARATYRDEMIIPTVDQLESLVTQVADALGGSSRGPIDWMKKKLTGFALNIATNQAVRRRGAISDAASPGAGDILLYQARGDAIRAFIQKKIQQASGPVFLLGHSLGGIACVDLLVSQHLPSVRTLITAGSQSPYFYEIGALSSLPTDKPLPDHFPNWINFYDPRDLLSYVGEKVFPGKVRDVKVESGQAFPHSHGAYWSQDVFWRELGTELARA